MMSNDPAPASPSPNESLILYQTPDGRVRVDCRAQDGTIWLSQAQIAEVFARSKQTISEHLRNLFEDNELQEESVVRNFRTTAADGKVYDVAHYNLEAILAIGFRVKSARGTQFRRWANTQLREYLVKGFVMDDQRFVQAGDRRSRAGDNNYQPLPDGSYRQLPSRHSHADGSTKSPSCSLNRTKY